MNATEQVIENIKIASETEANSLTEKELKIINQVKTSIKEKIKINCTACEYCMPCPSGVNIPACFDFYNNYHMFGEEKFYNWLSDKEKASKCVECGNCESHCPQGIQIRQELKNVKELFE